MSSRRRAARSKAQGASKVHQLLGVAEGEGGKSKGSSSRASSLANISRNSYSKEERLSKIKSLKSKDEDDDPKGVVFVDAPFAGNSVLREWGLFGKFPDDEGVAGLYFFCVGNEVCYKRTLKRIGMKLGYDQQKKKFKSTNGTSHIKMHGGGTACTDHAHEDSHDEEAEAKARKKIAFREQASEVVESLIPVGDPKRYFSLLFTRTFIIGKMVPFNFGDDPAIASFFRDICKNKYQDVSLHAEAMKRNVIDLYQYAKQTVIGLLNKGRPTLPHHIPCISFSADLVENEINGEIFLGLRIYWVDKNWQSQSKLLAVRRYHPTLEVMNEHRAGDLIKEWCEAVFEDYGLTWKDIFASTTDSGPDIKKLSSELLEDQAWEWCIMRMLNRVAIHGFGVELEGSQSKNPECRTLFDDVNKLLAQTQFGQPGFTHKEAQLEMFEKALRIHQIPAQRWTELETTLEGFLKTGGAIREAVTARRLAELVDTFERVQGNQQALIELLAILKAVSLVMSEGQASGYPTGALSLMHVLSLRTSTLNIEADLMVQPYDQDGNQVGDPVPYPHDDLQDVSRYTRNLLAEALDDKYLNKRYGKSAWGSRERVEEYWRDYVHDIGIMCHPTFTDLSYVKRIVPLLKGEDGARGSRVDEDTVRGRIINSAAFLVRKVLIRQKKKEASVLNESNGAGPSTDPGGDWQSPKKVRRISSSMSSDAKKRAAALHHLLPVITIDSSSEAVGDRDLHIMAEKKVKLFQTEAFDPRAIFNFGLDKTSEWWAVIGAERYPELAEVATSCFGVPAGSAVLENDFCMTTVVASSPRESMDPRYVEVIQTINAATKGSELPFSKVEPAVLKEGESIDKYLPKRVLDPNLFNRLSALYVEDEVERSQNESDVWGGWVGNTDSDNEAMDYGGEQLY